MPSGGGDQEVTQSSEPWAGAQGPLNEIFGAAGDLFKQGGPGYYPGQTFAGRDPLSDQAQNLRLNYATSSMPGQIYDAQRAQSFALNSPDAANNPYVQGMMQSNQFMANRNLSENLLPRISSGAAAAGQMGGSRQGIAEGLAMRGTQEGLMNANAKTMMDAYGKGLGAQQGALSMAPGLMGMGMQPMDVMSQTGQYNTGIDSQALSADRDRWDYNQNLPWDTLGKYNSIVQGAPWGSTQTTDGGGGSVLGSALGIGSLGLGAYNAGLFGGAGTIASGAGAAAPLAGGMSMAGMLNPALGAGLLGSSLLFN